MTTKKILTALIGLPALGAAHAATTTDQVLNTSTAAGSTVTSVLSGLGGAGGGQGVDVLGNAVKRVDTVAAVRLLGSSATTPYVATRGYAAVADGGAATYVYNSADSSADNGCTVLVDAASRRWDLTNAGGYVLAAQCGAFPSTSVDQYPAINAMQSALGQGGKMVFQSQPYLVDSPLCYQSGQHWVASGGNAEGAPSNTPTEFRLGASATAVFEPCQTTNLNIGLYVKGIEFNGQGNATRAAVLLQSTNLSTFDQSSAEVSGSGVSGWDLDGSVGQLYFNAWRESRGSATGTGGYAFLFEHGANVNQVYGGSVTGTYNGFGFLTNSVDNLVTQTDMESVSNNGVYADAPGNGFVCTHHETTTGTAIFLTSNATGTKYDCSSIAATVATPVYDGSAWGSFASSLTSGTEARWGMPGYRINASSLLSSATTLDIDPTPFTGTANLLERNWDRVADNSATQLKQYFIPSTTAQFTATFSGNVMTVSAVASGTIVANQYLGTSGIPQGRVQINAYGSGGTTGTGSTGTYQLSQSVATIAVGQTVVSQTRALGMQIDMNTGILSATAIAASTTASCAVAASGAVRMCDTNLLRFRNHANSADYTGLSKNTSDIVVVGDANSPGSAAAGYWSTTSGANVASASGIAVTGQSFLVTGTAQINTVGAPYTGFTGTICLLADTATGPFTLGTSGNIAVASTPTAGQAVCLVWNAGTSKWYPTR